jgi:hypothetical protein
MLANLNTFEPLALGGVKTDGARFLLDNGKREVLSPEGDCASDLFLS